MECRYGSDFMTLEDWKKGLRYFSEMKINTITVGLYGCWSRQYDGEFAEYLYIPFKKHPELSTPRHIKYYSAAEKKWVYKHDVLPVMFTEDYFGEMIKFGKKCNIKVIPLFNSMGHNTLIPRVHPEISAKDENGKDLGVGFCTSNEKTYDILFDIYDEIIERYLKPNGIDSFEVGLDEIWDVLGYDKNNLQEARSSFCKCEKCKNMTHAEIMTEHMIRLVKHLKEKGMKNVYVYHDMFFENDLLDEKLAKRLKDEGIFDTVVIDWWSYTGKEMLFHGKSDKVNGIFRGIGKPMTGYYHWNMPSHANPNIYAMLDVAMKNKFEGMTAYSSFEYSYDYPYNVFAECTWNPSDAKNEDEVLKRYALANFGSDALGAYRNLKIMNEITECMFPMTPMQNLFSYYMSCYLRGNTEYPQNYPAKQFKAIYDDEKKYLPYLRDIICRAGEVYNYFSENITSDISEDQQFGGVYFTAESLGLEDFKGCTVRMSVLFDENAADAVSDFTVFSDGVVWITSGISDENSGRWSKVSLTVPENASNTKIGFTIPVYSQYSGAVAYVDNVVVYKADGTAIENQGDYSLTSDGITVSIGTGGRIGLVIVLVILIFAIIGGIGFVVSTCLKRFT